MNSITQVRLIFISTGGDIGRNLIEEIGGVRLIFRIMLFVIIDRGFNSDDDTINNKFYFPCSGSWYWINSPNYFWSSNYAGIINLRGGGELNVNKVADIGGVQHFYKKKK